MRKIVILLLGIAAFFGGISGLHIKASGETIRAVSYELDGGYFDISLNQKLVKGGNQNILLQGDSTGNDENEWFYLTSTALAETYSLNSVQYYVWNDTHQAYGKPKRLSTGSDGKAYGVFTGLNETGIILPDSGSKNIANNDFEIVMHIAPDDWTATGVITSKFAGTNPREWSLTLGSSKLSFGYSMNGSTLLYAESLTIPDVVNGEDKYLKMSVDADNGSAQHVFTFYHSTDGLSWTSINTVVKEGLMDIYASTQNLEIGGRSGLTTNRFTGKIYEVSILKGLTNQEVIAHLDFGNRVDQETSFKDAYGNTYDVYGVIASSGSPNLNILNSSMPGAGISYSKNVTRFNKQASLPLTGSFISFGHNEGLDIDYTNDYLELVAMLKTKYPDIMIFGVTQNRQLSPRTSDEINAHLTRINQIKTLAPLNNMGIIDGYAAVSISNVSSDGVHLTSEGSIQWKDAAISAINTHKFKVYVLSEDVIDGTKATYFGVPKKTGYTFIGFYTDALFTQPFSTVMTNITEDVTLYAKWTPTTSGGSGSIIIDNAGSFTNIDYIIMGGAVLLLVAIFSRKNKKNYGGRRRS